MISGVWLPIVTPFVDGGVDFAGVFPLGTTGESPTLDEDEMEAIVDRTVSLVAAAALQGSQPHADQALFVAPGPDRVAGVPAAVDGDLAGPRR